MNAVAHIRQNVFGVTQAKFAEIAGVEQPTVSRWERGIDHPSLSHLRLIRAEARRRKLALSDSTFFDPKAASSTAAGTVKNAARFRQVAR
jgi:transcriptional regulator with XRE-family HTH domain